MLKENLRMILKSRLTWIIFTMLLVICMGYSFYNIYQKYLVFSNDSIIVNYSYLYDKPYAANSWETFYSYYSAILLLVVPISLSFVLVKKRPFVSVCIIRDNGVKQRIYQALSIAIITFVFFVFFYIISISAFYLTMGY